MSALVPETVSDTSDPRLWVTFTLAWLTVLVISRDVAIVMTAAIINLAVAPRTFKPSMLGKAATGTYILTGIVALYGNYRGLPDGLLSIFVYLTLAITLLSAADYLRRLMRKDAQGA